MILRLPYGIISSGLGIEVRLPMLLRRGGPDSTIAGSMRNLHSDSVLGLHRYKKRRRIIQTEFEGTSDELRDKMRKYAHADSACPIISAQDLSNILHLIEKKPEDLSLAQQVLKKFYSQNKDMALNLGFGIGTLAMRAYHFLNEPTQALAAVKDSQLDGLFDYYSPYLVIMDLLYSNGLHQEVLDLFEAVRKKLITEAEAPMYPFDAATLAMASCWKLNTLESYELALKILDVFDCVPSAFRQLFFFYFVAALALQQNSPKKALEIIDLIRPSTYVIFRNLQIMAFADLNRPYDAFPVLKYSVERSFTNPRNSVICADVIGRVAVSVDRLNNKELSLEFEGIQTAMTETKKISPENLETLMERKIQAMYKKPPPFTRRFERIVGAQERCVLE